MTVSNDVLANLPRLRDAVLREISYSADARELHISFQHWDGSVLDARLRGVLHTSISNAGEDKGDALVLNAKVEILEDGGQQVLSSLGYLWYESGGKARSYPGMPLIHFSIDGDTCIAVVCREFDLVPR